MPRMTSALCQFVAPFALEIFALHPSFRWIERRWPKRPIVDVSHLDDEAKRRIAKRANRLGTLVSLVAWPIVTAAWGFGFLGLQLAMVPHPPGTRFVRLPNAAMHMIPAIFAGIVLTGPVGLLTMRLVYFRRYHEVMAVGDAHYRYDVRNWLYATFVWIVPLCVDAESLWLGRYVVFIGEGILSRDLVGGSPRFHSYSEVVDIYVNDGIRRVDNRNLPDRGFVIAFRDGDSVPSPRFAYHDGRPEDFEPVKLSGRKSGVPIRWVQDWP
jgi:hypothetical protein